MNGWIDEWTNAAFGPIARNIDVYLCMLWQMDRKLWDLVWDSRTAFSSEYVTDSIWGLDSGIECISIFVSYSAIQRRELYEWFSKWSPFFKRSSSGFLFPPPIANKHFCREKKKKKLWFKDNRPRKAHKLASWIIARWTCPCDTIQIKKKHITSPPLPSLLVKCEAPLTSSIIY